MNKRGASIMLIIVFLALAILVLALNTAFAGKISKDFFCAQKGRMESTTYTCPSVQKLFMQGEGNKLLCGDVPDKEKPIIFTLVESPQECYDEAEKYREDEEEDLFVETFYTKESSSGFRCCIIGVPQVHPDGNNIPTLKGECCFIQGNEQLERDALCEGKGGTRFCNQQCQCELVHDIQQPTSPETSSIDTSQDTSSSLPASAHEHIKQGALRPTPVVQ